MARKRANLSGNPTVDVLIGELDSIGKRGRRRAQAQDDTVRAVQLARIIRRMTLGSETRERLRRPFLDMVTRLGGIRNNKRFTTAQRAELLGAGREALAKLPGQVKTQPAAPASTPPM